MDSAAATATAAWHIGAGTPAQPTTFDQTPAGMRQFQVHLVATGVAPAQILVVMEATGSYWMTLATTLHAAGYAVAVINPAEAHTLTRLAALLQPPPWSPPPAVYHELAQRMGQRDDLMTVRQQCKNQRHALVQHPVVVASVQHRLETLITTLTEEIATLEAEIAPALAQDAAWAAAADRLQSIPGIGLTLNFSLCPSADAAAAYAGLGS